ncbi:MAG: hypothetical protein ACXW25_10360 [Rhodospirillales bacterium]
MSQGSCFARSWRSGGSGGLAGIDAGVRERDDDPQERALAEARFTASAR